MRKLMPAFLLLAGLLMIDFRPTKAFAGSQDQSRSLVALAPLSPTSCDQELIYTDYQPARVPKYLFIGVRGSGEKVTDGAGTGMGLRMEFLFDRIRADRRFSDIACTGILFPKDRGSREDRYLALGVPSGTDTDGWDKYVRDIGNNFTELKVKIAQLAKNYPQTKLIIAGYSQGAGLVHLAVAAALKVDPAVARNISNVILVANPFAEVTDPNISPAGTSRKDKVNWTTSAGVVTIGTSILGRKLDSPRAAAYTAAKMAGSIASNRLVEECSRLPFPLTPVVNRCKSSLDMGNLVKGYVDVAQQLNANWDGVWKNFFSSPSQLKKTHRINVISICQRNDLVCAPLGEGFKYATVKVPKLGRVNLFPTGFSCCSSELHTNPFGKGETPNSLIRSLLSSMKTK